VRAERAEHEPIAGLDLGAPGHELRQALIEVAGAAGGQAWIGRVRSHGS
jgi:hypothetical protein